MNAHSRILAAEQVFELHAVPGLPLPKVPGDDSPLFVGDIVTIMFSLQSAGAVDLRGTVTEVYRHNRYKIETIDDAGDTRKVSVPRELLRLVRRADA